MFFCSTTATLLACPFLYVSSFPVVRAFSKLGETPNKARRQKSFAPFLWARANQFCCDGSFCFSQFKQDRHTRLSMESEEEPVVSFSSDEEYLIDETYLALFADPDAPTEGGSAPGSPSKQLGIFEQSPSPLRASRSSPQVPKRDEAALLESSPRPEEPNTDSSGQTGSLPRGKRKRGSAPPSPVRKYVIRDDGSAVAAPRYEARKEICSPRTRTYLIFVLAKTNSPLAVRLLKHFTVFLRLLCCLLMMATILFPPVCMCSHLHLLIFSLIAFDHFMSCVCFAISDDQSEGHFESSFHQLCAYLLLLVSRCNLCRVLHRNTTLSRDESYNPRRSRILLPRKKETKSYVSTFQRSG